MGSISADKRKAVEFAMGQIERQFGKGSIMKLGGQVLANVPVISTGSLALDRALGVEVKFYSNRIRLSPNLETEVTNLFAVGDGAGITRGLLQASASGIIAGQTIAKRLRTRAKKDRSDKL